jgi:hypothetical protein
MKFGVREICNVVFRAKSNVKIGTQEFKVGQPVLYIDSAKTSTLEGAATTVYAQGGRGNTRLIAWEGEKTLTFTVEDALISPIGLSVLTGAGLIKNNTETVHVHMTTNALIDNSGEIKLTDAVAGAKLSEEAPLFVMELVDGSLTGAMISDITVSKNTAATADKAGEVVLKSAETKNKTVMVDYYVEKASANVSEIQIDAANFAGYYYVEADTLFRRQSDGVDMPANITLPNVKIQSNFTFTMASTGDPSTFTFTMDAFPGYTYFNNKKQVLCVIQVVEDAEGSNVAYESVMAANESVDEEGKTVNNDSVSGTNPWTVTA